MRDTKLIVVEGIMGAGKSTTAAFIADQLRRHQYAARFLPEGPTHTEPDHPLRVATALPHPHAPWRDVTVAEFRELSLGKWASFVRDAEQSVTITVCDGLLFHGNMTDLLLMNAEPPVLHDYVRQVIEIAHSLNPVVIYFYHADVSRALRAVCDGRGSEWEAYQVNWKLASPYSVRRSLHGFEGLVELYQAYRAITDELFAQLTLPKLSIRNEGDWVRYYHDILTFLQVPPTPPAVPG